MATCSDPVAEFEDVIKDYATGLLGRRTLRAVAGVSLRLEAGEVFGLLGPNRAGKTTLLKILLSLCQPTAGRVTRFGHSTADRRSLARVGYVHENLAFPRYLTAAGLLEYYGAATLVPYEDVRRRVPELLERVGLTDRRHEPIHQFSKGMIQRLGLAQALLNDPDLLVMDEPSEGLDLTGRRLVREVILDQRQRGKTVLLVSHLLTEVEQVCDRVGVLVAGRLVHTGPLSRLLHDPHTGGVRRLENALQAFYEAPAA
jgi:ABC-2 type transport system ATP-binding protein